jgi:hypothetical protein
MPRPPRAVSYAAWHLGAVQRLSDLIAAEPTGARAHAAAPALRSAGGAAPPPSGAAAPVTDAAAFDYVDATRRLGALLQHAEAAAAPPATMPSPEEERNAANAGRRVRQRPS